MPKNKNPTQTDVARLANVSQAIVSHVLNNNPAVSLSAETRQRVWEAIQTLGYEPDASAQALRSGNTKTIGLIVPDMHNPHFWQYADGVEQEADARGYHVLLSSMNLNPEQGEKVLRELSRQRIDGLILTGALFRHSEKARSLLPRILQRGLAVVEITEHLAADYHLDRVVGDYRAATMELMSHLLSLQHRRIGLIYGVHAALPAEDRLLPYQQSLQAAGLPLDAALVANCGPTIEDAYAAARHLLQLPARPTALIAVNDLLAIGALRAAVDLGLNVPRDLSLAGYDDIPISKHLVPRLTTATKDTVGMGRAAVRLLLERIADTDRPVQTVEVLAGIVIRESTGPAPH